MSRKAERVARLMEATGDALLTVTEGAGIPRDTCVLHARAAMVALQDNGVRAVPLPCQLLVENAKWRELARAKGGPPDEEEQDAWADQGARIVAIGYSDPENVRPDRWNGHLVLAVEGRFLFDLTLDQANRPDYGIVLPACFALDARPLIRGEVTDGAAEFDGVAAIYTPFRNWRRDRSFMEDSWHAWTRRESAELRTLMARTVREKARRSR